MNNFYTLYLQEGFVELVENFMTRDCDNMNSEN